MSLDTLQVRIKNARLYIAPQKRIRRLYIPYGQNRRGVKTSVWFEIVNDRLQVFCRVENDRHTNYYDDQTAAIIKSQVEKQFYEIINKCELLRKKVPLNERLRDDIIPVYEKSLKHQADALRFCCSMKVSALFADTGTGKTKIAIDLCVSRYEAGQIRKVLVFGPVSTKRNFQKEIDKWCKDLPIEWRYVGSESMGSSDRVFLETLDWVDSETQIIVDESHMIKSPLAKRSKRIKSCTHKTSYKLVMTGTPVTENVHNLYMQYSILSDLIIGVSSWLKFEERYLIIGGRSGDEIIGYKNIDHLMGLIEPYTYQISAEDAIHLPSKEFHEHVCHLTREQEEFYSAEREALLEIIERDEVYATDIFQVFTRMQQIVSGYYLDRSGKKHMLETTKLNMIEKIPLEDKTIFFCKYIFEVQQLIERLGKENCAVFTGENRKNRDNELDSFVSGNKRYFVATMQSGGTGLNGLQIASSRIVFVSNSFSYFQRKQSIGRIDRQGQTCKMHIHDLLTYSGIDDRIMKNLRRKGNLADEIKDLLKDKTKLKKYIQEL